MEFVHDNRYSFGYKREFRKCWGKQIFYTDECLSSMMYQHKKQEQT